MTPLTAAPSRVRCLVLCGLAAQMVSLSGCLPLPLGGTGQPGALVPPKAPDISVTRTTLRHLPREEAVGLHYCYEHAPVPFVCRAFGPEPTAADLAFVLDVGLRLNNPNPIPLPVVQALVAFSAYPEEVSEQNLGAVCLALCGSDGNGGGSCGPVRDNACESDEPEIRSLDDFAMASANFLVASILGERGIEDLRVRTIAPGESLELVIRLELSPTQMLALIERSVGDGMNQTLSGRFPSLEIPYRFEGSIWVTVENFGRFAAPFGPIEGSWNLGEVALNAR